MTRNDVINGLEHCKIGDCVGCPYDQTREESLHGKHNKWELVCNEKLTEDILALLKEQEAVKPRVSSVEQRCGNCNKVIEMDGWKVCPWCGKPILWEAVGRSVK